MNVNPEIGLPSTMPTEIAEPAADPYMEMLREAVLKGNTDLAGKIMDLQVRWEQNQASRDYDEAITAAKAEIPIIKKNKKVGQLYKYEDLPEIARTIDEILSRHGLTYRWKTKTEKDLVTVTCVLSHRGGHKEETTLSCSPDVGQNRNPVQGLGSALTYLQRYTLRAALGLAASADDDARSVVNVQAITADEAQTLRDMIKAAGETEQRFLKLIAKTERIEDIESTRYDACVEAILAAKRRQMETANGKK